MSKIEELQALKSKVENMERLAQQAKGELRQLTKQIKEEFGCGNLKEAKAKLAELQKAEIEAEEKFDKAYAAFQEEWGGKLRG